MFLIKNERSPQCFKQIYNHSLLFWATCCTHATDWTNLAALVSWRPAWVYTNNGMVKATLARDKPSLSTCRSFWPILPFRTCILGIKAKPTNTRARPVLSLHTVSPTQYRLSTLSPACILYAFSFFSSLWYLLRSIRISVCGRILDVFFVCVSWVSTRLEKQPFLLGLEGTFNAQTEMIQTHIWVWFY